MQRIANLVVIEKLKNEYFVAKIGFDAEENEPSKIRSFHLAEKMNRRAANRHLIRGSLLASWMSVDVGILSNSV